jgi:hypothetical protein
LRPATKVAPVDRPRQVVRGADVVVDAIRSNVLVFEGWPVL